MDWDDGYDNGHEDMDYVSHREEPMPDKSTEVGIDPMDIANPVSAYFFLSDNAQDEISGSDKKKMKCASCGHVFKDGIYDRCPECFSSDTEDVAGEKDHGYW